MKWERAEIESVCCWGWGGGGTNFNKILLLQCSDVCSLK